jgi:hypothetical protein
MTQAEINRAVAAVTGESPAKISRLGFDLADPLDVNFDPEPTDVPHWIDWDQVNGRGSVQTPLSSLPVRVSCSAYCG